MNIQSSDLSSRANDIPLSPPTVCGDKGNTNEEAESDMEWDGGKGAEKWRHLFPLILVLLLSFPTEW